VGQEGAAAAMKISVISLNVKRRKSPLESFLGLGSFAVWHMELFTTELCFWAGEVSPVCLSQFLGP